MITLMIYGAPKLLKSDIFISALQQRFAGMNVLKLKPEDIIVKFLGEDSNDIITFVENFPDSPERTVDVRNELTDRITTCCFHYLPDVRSCACTIRPFDPMLGFCSILKIVK